jgi:hypothetical protein
MKSRCSYQNQLVHLPFLERSPTRSSSYFSTSLDSLPRSDAISLNCSSAACRSSMISAAMMSGAGKFAESSRASSLSRKMSRLTLSRLEFLNELGGLFCHVGVKFRKCFYFCQATRVSPWLPSRMRTWWSSTIQRWPTSGSCSIKVSRRAVNRMSAVMLCIPGRKTMMP